MSKITRRQSLKHVSAGLAGIYSVISFSPFKAFAQSLAGNIIDEAASKHLNNKFSRESARKLLHINLSGAPTRWYFDHLLKPTDDHEFVAHPRIGTELIPPGPGKPLIFETAYKTVKMNGFNFPSVWQNNVAKAGGGTRPMAELQNHLLMIRGCDMLIDGHPVNTMKQVTDTQGDLSITGLAADGSKLLLPAVSMGSCTATDAFRGNIIRKAVEIPFEEENYFDYLFSGFYESTAELQELAAAEQAALGIIESVYQSNSAGSDILFNQKRQARELVRKKLNKFRAVYSGLVQKYEDLFTRSYSSQNVNGLCSYDYSFPPLPLTVQGEVTQTALLNFLKGYNINGAICETRFADFSRTVVFKKMAQQFAIAEFCLTENLSASITLSPKNSWAFSDQDFVFDGGEESSYKLDFDAKLNQSTISRAAPPEKFRRTARFDSHALGFHQEFMLANYFYAGFSAALLELIDRLKEIKFENTTLFNETVIHVASEFERQPITGAYEGSDHNWHAGVSSVFSGIVKKPMLVGNIYVESQDEARPGTRGDAAPMAELNNTHMNHRHVLSTLSEMLRVKRIVARAKPLVEVKNDEVVGVIEAPKNIRAEAKSAKS